MANANSEHILLPIVVFLQLQFSNFLFSFHLSFTFRNIFFRGGKILGFSLSENSIFKNMFYVILNNAIIIAYRYIDV